MESGANSALRPEAEMRFGAAEASTFFVCIPAYNESGLLRTLQSLYTCNPIPKAAVILVLNASETDAPEVPLQNRITYDAVSDWVRETQPWFAVCMQLYSQLPAKKSGVGLARKLAMDMALQWQPQISNDVVLACLDADCTVAPNYFECINDFFYQEKNIVAASVYFEHPEPEDAFLAKAIADYELHLRYLKNALKWCGYPWYFHTVGSSMAVRATTYKAMGGMNTRKAGEDFYFLHKLMPLGFGEINTTTVFPEARFSNRVPFGTGRSMLDLHNGTGQKTYAFAMFRELKVLFDNIAESGGLEIENIAKVLHPSLVKYLADENANEAWQECLNNSSSKGMALNRFYKWFSGFRIVHFMHFLRDNGFPTEDVYLPAAQLLQELQVDAAGHIPEMFRRLDRQ